MDPNSPQNKSRNPKTSTHNDVQTSPKTPPPPPSSALTTPTPIPREYVRYYTCTFCEKGFSNAQALGGHMNIHRRDRARLRNLDDSELDTRRGTIISWQRDRRLQTTSFDEQDRSQVLWLFGGDNPRGDSGQGSNGGDPGIDLELRLGLEPSTSSSSSARKGI